MIGESAEKSGEACVFCSAVPGGFPPSSPPSKNDAAYTSHPKFLALPQAIPTAIPISKKCDTYLHNLLIAKFMAIMFCNPVVCNLLM